MIGSGFTSVCSTAIARQIKCKKIRHTLNSGNIRGDTALNVVQTSLCDVSEIIEESTMAISGVEMVRLPDERSVQLLRAQSQSVTRFRHHVQISGQHPVRTAFQSLQRGRKKKSRARQVCR